MDLMETVLRVFSTCFVVSFLNIAWLCRLLSMSLCIAFLNVFPFAEECDRFEWICLRLLEFFFHVPTTAAEYRGVFACLCLRVPFAS